MCKVIESARRPKSWTLCLAPRREPRWGLGSFPLLNTSVYLFVWMFSGSRRILIFILGCTCMSFKFQDHKRQSAYIGTGFKILWLGPRCQGFGNNWKGTDMKMRGLIFGEVSWHLNPNQNQWIGTDLDNAEEGIELISVEESRWASYTFYNQHPPTPSPPMHVKKNKGGKKQKRRELSKPKNHTQ